MSQILHNEARVISRYLGAYTEDDQLHRRYETAIDILQISLSADEHKLMVRVLIFSFLLPFVDGGLALLQHDHPLRKRILVMNALMETDPKYVQLFLTDNITPMATAKLLYRGSAALIKGVLGCILITVFRWK
jgi:hypothetical protein